MLPSKAMPSDRRVRLERRVGGGATATVWLSTLAGERVALKLGRTAELAPIVADEAMHAALALSPRLPELVDLGVARLEDGYVQLVADEAPGEGTVPFLALRWIEGDRLVLDHGLSAVSVARDVAEALADLHDVGLAHGDVKPDNIIVDGDGRAALVDLGLCGPSGARKPKGGTPRYLGQGDRDLGDARARDLLALGIVLAEMTAAEVARAEEPLAVARRTVFPAEVTRIISALLAPEPGARPSARWVHEVAATALGEPSAERVERWKRSVRAGYLRLRRHEIRRADGVSGPAAPWLASAVEIARRARRLADPSGARDRGGDPPLGPLPADGRLRWLTGLVGSAAASWSPRALETISERELAVALVDLASRKRPATWTLIDVEAAATGRPGSTGQEEALEAAGRGPISPQTAAQLALRVARLPLDVAAVELVERVADRAPAVLVLAAADALRLAGELGRARSLVLQLRAGDAIAADILRRAGDLEEAASVASGAIERGLDPDDRARACLARIHLDAGELDEVEGLVDGRQTAAALEVAALLAMTRGHRHRAIEHAERGLALAATPEARARLTAALAFARTPSAEATAGTSSFAAREGYRLAAEHALRAGAILEEASYRQGEAATCVDLGEIAVAIETAQRAALLWDEVLGRPSRAARAWHACAAAYAAVDARHEALHAAEQALACAIDAGDTRTEAFACWEIADASEPGSAEGKRAALRAVELLGDGLDNEGVHAAARLYRHDPQALPADRKRTLDRAATADGSVAAYARMTWWWARAERLLLDGTTSGAEAESALTELAALAEVSAPVATRARAMHAAAELAAARGDSALLARFEASRAEAARPIIAGAGEGLADALRACRWTRPHTEIATSAISREKAIDLQYLVRALSERGSLRALLDRVIDVLLLWTRAERGLLLLRRPDGGLVPRSARNLRREDLRGEQLTVSTTLAERALETGEPLIAVDAMEELSRSYQSVHALRLRSVLVVPLSVQGEVQGVAYLDDRMRTGAFGDRELELAQAIGPIAGLAIADARARVRLRRAVRKAERASSKLEEALAHKEAALDVAERELASVVGARETRHRYDDIIGESAAIRRMLRLMDKVAASEVPVLLRGESGSGKELVARAIHQASARATQAFVGENCGALPETLLESALFGHVKGAFTGAHRANLGLFEAAHEGSLFLDEIGEMSLGMQTKLLRVLEDGVVRPVGSVHGRKVDVRIIAATHRNLEQMVAEGSFREDLYYRLNVITIAIPPLRERKGDIPLIADHLIAKHAADQRPRLTAAASDWLTRQPWPGNVRQLENEIRRALLLCDDVIDLEHLSTEEGDDRAVVGLDVRTHIDRLETELVGEALARTNGNQTQAAKLLGVSRFRLHKMMKRLKISVDREPRRDRAKR